MAWLIENKAVRRWLAMLWVVLCAVLTALPVPSLAQEADPGQAAMQTMIAPLAQPRFIAAAPSGDVFAPSPGLVDHARALDCMSVAIAYEAAGQPVAGQQAVGQVILNRMRDARFPKTICGVVFQGSERLTGCQFTFTCDGSFRRRLADTTLMTARGIAETVLSGAAPDRVAGATHYHADYVLPYWAASGRRVARIGAHIFYRMPGTLLPGALPLASNRAEPDVPALHRLAGRRGWGRLGPALAQGGPGAAHAVFTAWGLPVAGVAQR